jgi:hypothetical protein
MVIMWRVELAPDHHWNSGESGGFARQCRDRIDATQVGERGFTMELGEVLAGGDQVLTGMLGTDAKQRSSLKPDVIS